MTLICKRKVFAAFWLKFSKQEPKKNVFQLFGLPIFYKSPFFTLVLNQILANSWYRDLMTIKKKLWSFTEKKVSAFCLLIPTELIDFSQLPFSQDFTVIKLVKTLLWELYTTHVSWLSFLIQLPFIRLTKIVSFLCL